MSKKFLEGLFHSNKLGLKCMLNTVAYIVIRQSQSRQRMHFL